MKQSSCLPFSPIEKTNDSLQKFLDKRKELHLYRSLTITKGLIDFCSNDYLSFARSEVLKEKIKSQLSNQCCFLGATGSRSISGNTIYAEDLEKFLAQFHHAEAALLFNSGYNANVGFFSSVVLKGDIVITDELIHASIIDGCRLSYAQRFKFRHNDYEDLQEKLEHIHNTNPAFAGNIFVAVESVYSMDGDMSPLKEIASICKHYNACLVVDEAHATGIFGENGKGLVCALGLEEKVFARIHTFGKAMGTHGAVVLGSRVLKNYLINFARSFIFTTALPPHTLLSIMNAYQLLMSKDFQVKHLHQLIRIFKNHFTHCDKAFLIESITPVQSIIIPGNKRVKEIALQLRNTGFDVKAIVSPSVPLGKERLRISLHMHNDEIQIKKLLQKLKELISTI